MGPRGENVDGLLRGGAGRVMICNPQKQVILAIVAGSGFGACEHSAAEFAMFAKSIVWPPDGNSQVCSTPVVVQNDAVPVILVSPSSE